MNAYVWLIGIVLAFLFTAGIQAAVYVSLGVVTFALVFAGLTAPIWITYYLAKAVHAWTNKKQ